MAIYEDANVLTGAPIVNPRVNGLLRILIFAGSDMAMHLHAACGVFSSQRGDPVAAVPVASSPFAAADTPTRVSQTMPPWARLGILFGLLGATSIALFGPIGVSGTYPRFVGAIADLLLPGSAAATPYLAKMGRFLGPESMIVVGLLIGGFLASRLGHAARAGRRAPKVEIIHAHESTRSRRYAGAFIGGVLIVFGARLAGGCTSGHIISGITQLSLSGFAFGAGVFATGILTAKTLKRGY